MGHRKESFHCRALKVISLGTLSPAHILSLEYGQSKWERPELVEKLKNYRPVREAVAEHDSGHLVTYKAYIKSWPPDLTALGIWS